jgi:hypothetical protein
VQPLHNRGELHTASDGVGIMMYDTTSLQLLACAECQACPGCRILSRLLLRCFVQRSA